MLPIIKKLAVLDTCSIMLALEKLESTRFQIVFVVNKEAILLGIITNGDLRRYLIAGGSTEDPVEACMNRKYCSVGVDASREELLKLLDLGYHVIPKINSKGQLVDIVTSQYDFASPEAPILTRARAPVRISFSGGGSDVTYFFIDNPAAVLSTTVALYAHATLVPRSDNLIVIHSEDLNTIEKYDSLAHLLEAHGKGLLSSVVSVIKPTYGFELFVRSDFPIGSGLGGSSAVAAAIVAAFNEMRLDRWSTYEVAELAFQAERLCFGVAGGWQDQYASAFGGFNLIELSNDKNLVHPIRLEPSIVHELEESLILCDTNLTHDSGKLHENQRKAIRQEDKSKYLKEMVEICRKMHRQLIRGELIDFGRSLGLTWVLKRNLSSEVSNSKLDSIYQTAIKSGALGGKLLGAGGGGFFLFYIQPQMRKAVSSRLEEIGCTLRSLRFTNEGVTSWRSKVN